MSKLNIDINYKNACILKHSLANRIKTKEGLIVFIEGKRERENLSPIELPYNKSTTNKRFLIEIEEEKQCLVAITEEINREKERLGII
jgi:hypothetical protein